MLSLTLWGKGAQRLGKQNSGCNKFLEFFYHALVTGPNPALIR